MPQGDKAKYTDKQKRKAEHIADGYRKRGLSEKESVRRAWATVNRIHAGGEKPGGGGYGKPLRRTRRRTQTGRSQATRKTKPASRD